MTGKTPANKGISPPKHSCPHCDKEASWANLQKWHNEKCKMIDPDGHRARAVGITNLHVQRRRD